MNKSLPVGLLLLLLFGATARAQLVVEITQGQADAIPIAIVPFGSMEEVIQRANDTPYGLAAYIWTNDLKTAIFLSEKLEFGMIGINEWAPHATEAPFGGWKQSGIGFESGSEGLYEYLEKKLISIGGL